MVQFFVSRKRGEQEARERATRRTRERHGAPAGPPPPTVIDPEIRFDAATGRNCVLMRRVRGEPGSAGDEANQAAAHRMLERNPLCSGSPTGPARPVPGVAAAEVWRRQVQLPSPTVHVAPGWAITGKPAYLEVGGPASLAREYEALGYRVVIEATSTYDVDWGDGTVERGRRSRGGPWPGGDLTHVYTDVGTYTITVTQRWSARWRVGEATGALDEVLRTTASFTLPTRQLQAVRRR